MNTSTRFTTLLTNLRLTDTQKSDGKTKNEGVRYTLNRHYYNSYSLTDNSFLVGSWGKETRIRPPRDVDVMFVLPYAVFERINALSGNKQSALLQEVKGVLAATYSTTTMRGDGQVVMVGFDSYAVEVAPAFPITEGRYIICDTNGGGSWKTVDPKSEAAKIDASNSADGGDTKQLVRMLKRWQAYCSVPMKSFWLELLAIDFLSSWAYRGKGVVFYDWMIRDFFKWLVAKGKYHYVIVPGTAETIWLGDAWMSRAESAEGRATKATDFDANKQPCAAGGEWQKIFGDFIPLC